MATCTAARAAGTEHPERFLSALAFLPHTRHRRTPSMTLMGNLGYRSTALDALQGADLTGRVAVVTGKSTQRPCLIQHPDATVWALPVAAAWRHAGAGLAQLAAIHALESHTPNQAPAPSVSGQGTHPGLSVGRPTDGGPPARCPVAPSILPPSWPPSCIACRRQQWHRRGDGAGAGPRGRRLRAVLPQRGGRRQGGCRAAAGRQGEAAGPRMPLRSPVLLPGRSSSTTAESFSILGRWKPGRAASPCGGWTLPTCPVWRRWRPRSPPPFPALTSWC